MMESLALKSVASAFENDPSMLLQVKQFFNNSRHEDVLNKLAQIDPFTVHTPSTLDTILNKGTPLAIIGYSMFVTWQKRKAMNEARATIIEDSDVARYMSQIYKPTGTRQGDNM